MVPGRRAGLITPAEIDAFVADAYPAMAGSGVRCVEVTEGMVEVVWRYDATQLRPGDYISGATQFALADAALWYATFTVVGLEAMAVTTDLQITFLRPAMGGDLRATAEVVSVGRARIHGDVRLWVGDDRRRLVSHATGTYALPAPTR